LRNRGTCFIISNDKINQLLHEYQSQIGIEKWKIWKNWRVASSILGHFLFQARSTWPVPVGDKIRRRALSSKIQFNSVVLRSYQTLFALFISLVQKNFIFQNQFTIRNLQKSPIFKYEKPQL
jgi:hypothetical protein